MRKILRAILIFLTVWPVLAGCAAGAVEPTLTAEQQAARQWVEFRRLMIDGVDRLSEMSIDNGAMVDDAYRSETLDVLRRGEVLAYQLSQRDARRHDDIILASLGFRTGQDALEEFDVVGVGLALRWLVEAQTALR